jgi:hypothetical protein
VTGTAFFPGDLVEHHGEQWTVDELEPATAYKPARVVLGHTTVTDGIIRATVTDAAPEELRLVCRGAERTLFPGCDLLDMYGDEIRAGLRALVEAAETRDLTARLAAWIDAEGITGNYDTAEIAARVTAALAPSLLAAWLNQGGTPYLRDMCARIKDCDDLTDGEFAAELYLHGH